MRRGRAGWGEGIPSGGHGYDSSLELRLTTVGKEGQRDSKWAGIRMGTKLNLLGLGSSLI